MRNIIRFDDQADERPVTPDTRILLASCAGSFLLLLAFLFLSVLTVALYMLWRGLRMARAQLPVHMAHGVSYALRAERSTQSTAGSVIEPQIRVASALAGIRAGTRALIGRSAVEGPGEAADQSPS